MTPTIPTPQQVRDRLVQFDHDDRYSNAERAIQLAVDQRPTNADVVHILIKAVLINRLYSTNIFNIYAAAKHILSLHIDERLQRGDPSLVGEIADMHIGKGGRYNLAFAAKYCAWHQPDHFQIFDNLVANLLWKYRQAHAFASFKRTDLRDYPSFIKIIDKFREFFALGDFSRKDIDKFLWIEAKSSK